MSLSHSFRAMWKAAGPVGANAAIQEEYKRMDEDMRISVAALIDSFWEFITTPALRGEKRAQEWTDVNITLLEGDVADADAQGKFPRAKIDVDARKIEVVTRVRADAVLRVLQRSPWHIWSDVFTSFFIAAAPQLRTYHGLTDFEKPLIDIAQMSQRINEQGKFAIPIMLLDTLTLEAQAIAMLGFAAFQDWLHDSADARPLLNLNMRIWQTTPPFEAVFMSRVCEFLEQFPETTLVFDGLEWAKARPLRANAIVPWALHFVGETVSDLNVMWWPDHLSADDKQSLINGLERLHSQASLMTQMLLHS